MLLACTAKGSIRRYFPVALLTPIPPKTIGNTNNIPFELDKTHFIKFFLA